MVLCVSPTVGIRPEYAELSLPTGRTAGTGSGDRPRRLLVASYAAELGRPLAADLVGRGYAALNVEYRRVGDGGGWPQTGQDVAAAVDGLRGPVGRTAPQQSCRPWSFGRRAARWVAAARRGGAVPLTGAVLQAGVLDLVRGSAEGLGGGAVDAYLGGTPAQKPQMRMRKPHRSRWCRWACHRFACTAPQTRWCRSSQSEDFVAAGLARRRCHRVAGRSTATTSGPITVGTPAWEMCVAGLRRLTDR